MCGVKLNWFWTEIQLHIWFTCRFQVDCTYIYTLYFKKLNDIFTVMDNLCRCVFKVCSKVALFPFLPFLYSKNRCSIVVNRPLVKLSSHRKKVWFCIAIGLSQSCCIITGVTFANTLNFSIAWHYHTPCSLTHACDSRPGVGSYFTHPNLVRGPSQLSMIF